MVNDGVVVLVVGMDVVDARKVACGRVIALAGRDSRGLRRTLVLSADEDRGIVFAARRSRRGLRLDEPVEFVRYIAE